MRAGLEHAVLVTRVRCGGCSPAPCFGEGLRWVHVLGRATVQGDVESAVGRG
ncbi:unnamed protein product [Chondrus crispus]|uniref:Uncharacterized protein n=1 Tax=Chondrus crispus TaxID=2769 RepID=R7QC00_CHOCR|nr:unnamed protein product [Chondrus crispus]CDF36012.1 unnamed protein product [Chondrus crispus]|eukprot:XP_005715831.1 unnamed protein product [Chondrus crispus]